MPKSTFDLSQRTATQTPFFTTARSARVVWLRQRNRDDEKARELARQMQEEGLTLTVLNAYEVSSADLLNADLVLLDAFESLEGSVETVVSRIRFESRVPLIMLADGYSTEQLVSALTGGADAIWSPRTPVEILLARCKALLRRWPPVKD